jgi:hypothetical protein
VSGPDQCGPAEHNIGKRPGMGGLHFGHRQRAGNQHRHLELDFYALRRPHARGESGNSNSSFVRFADYLYGHCNRSWNQCGCAAHADVAARRGHCVAEVAVDNKRWTVGIEHIYLDTRPSHSADNQSHRLCCRYTWRRLANIVIGGYGCLSASNAQRPIYERQLPSGIFQRVESFLHSVHDHEPVLQLDGASHPGHSDQPRSISSHRHEYTRCHATLLSDPFALMRKGPFLIRGSKEPRRQCLKPILAHLTLRPTDLRVTMPLIAKS